MEQLFSHILDQDEKVEIVYKPQKLKLFCSTFLLSAFSMLVVCGGLALSMFTEEYAGAEPIHYLVPVGIFVLSQVLTLFWAILKYKKTFYAITSKRVIVRTGVIGVDYKSLDLSNIGATDVYVGLLDKILGSKTGSISFGSASSPLNSQTASAYAFKHVENPYETYKQVKLKIEEHKNGKAQ